MKSSHRPKKSLGQNFLTDPRIQQKIVDSCDLKPTDTVIEIGPGQGVITRLIALKVKQVICVEKDRDLIEALSQEFAGTNVEVVCADFLKWDISGYVSSLPPNALIGGGHPVKLIGNIPYYISTPILEKLIEAQEHLSIAYLTVQLEFGRRLAALPGCKEYGALTCFVQYWADVQLLFKIKNTCFRPAPKVDSCFMRLDFTRPPLYRPRHEQLMFMLIRTAFTQRRKTLLNALSSVVQKERLEAVLQDFGISLKVRPEELNLQNFVDISNRLANI